MRRGWQGPLPTGTPGAGVVGPGGFVARFVVHFSDMTKRPWCRAFRLGPFAIVIAAAVAVLCGSGTRAAAQDGGAADGDVLGEVPVAVRDEVEMRVVRVGPGGRTRAGDWGGVLIEFRDSALDAREVFIRLTGHDRDGDPPTYDQLVATSPTGPTGVWVYGVMPYASVSGRIAISAHEAIGVDGDGHLGTGFEVGRVLGRAWVNTSALVEPELGLVGVVGSRDLGLRQYGVTIESGWASLPLGHEATVVSSGLTVEDIPDRWHGLASYSTLVWTRRGTEMREQPLTGERAAAVMEWVRRGGHLVVALPPVGQEWLVPDRHPLSPVMPRMVIERREGVDLEMYRGLLTLDRGAELPDASVVHVMAPAPGAARAEAMPVLNGPDGGCVVMRRAVGTGMVSVLGIDPGAGGLVSSGTLDAEALWHRVLGKRQSLDTFEEVKSRDRDLSSSIQQRAAADYDADFESEIDRTGDSTTGVLLSLVVFGLYWLLAGPIGFVILSKTGRRAFAWVGFVGAAGAFTALAWVGASALRPTKVEGKHLAFVTEVSGTGTQHAEAWMSVLIPSYGRATISVGSDGRGDDLLSPWTPPPPTGTGGGFPDNRSYGISSRRPTEMTPPVRSTIKQLAVDWAGEPRWGSIGVAGEPGQIEDAGLVLADPDNAVVEGDLIHDLPGALTDVLVVVVAGQRVIPSGSIGALWMPSRVFMDKPGLDEWLPGQRLDLKAVTGSGARTSLERSGLTWLRDAGTIGEGRGLGADGVLQQVDPRRRFTAMAFFDMFERPDFLQIRNAGRTAPLATRRVGHGLDLSAWLTQPCVIVIGHLVQDDAGPCPVPASVDGEALLSRGRTVVRWVYPLEPSPPAYVDGPGPGDG